MKDSSGLIGMHRHDDMKDLRCMSFTSKGTVEIILAGLQDDMLVVDLIKGDVVKQVRLPTPWCLSYPY